MRILILLVNLMLLASCSNSEKEDSLIVGTSADNPPYEFIQDNKITGLDIEITNAIGEKLKKKVVIKNFEFNGLLAALISKNVDFIIAGLSVTPEREASVDFSDKYLSTKVAVLYRNEDNLTVIDDLKDKVVGVQMGTIWEKMTQEFASEIHFKTHSLSNNLMLIEELKSKTVDAIMLEETQSKRFVSNNPDFNYFILEDQVFEFAIALPKNSELKSEINKAINELEQEGVLKAIRQKWLGTASSIKAFTSEFFQHSGLSSPTNVGSASPRALNSSCLHLNGFSCILPISQEPYSKISGGYLHVYKYLRSLSSYAILEKQLLKDGQYR